LIRHVAHAAPLLALSVAAGLAAAGEPESRPLVDDRGALTEEALEALLAPAEFAKKPFAYESRGDEAQFCLDVSAGASGVTAVLNPERVRWPSVGGVPVAVRGGGLALAPSSPGVTAEAIDRGVTISWTLAPLGQVFSPRPALEVEVIAAVVRSAADGAALLAYRAPAPAPRCRDDAPAGAPRCDLDGVGREARALALAPRGGLVAVAMGGLKPRLEMYAVADGVRLEWTALFPPSAGGVVEVAFSTDGRWIVALTGDGRLHRLDARTGGLHLVIPSRGRAARALAPGRAIAVAGDGGEVTLWNLADGTIAWRLPPRNLRGPVDKLAASGDGHRFATLEYDADKTVVRVWDAARRALVAQVAVDPYEVSDIALDEAGGRVFISHDKDGLLAADVAAGAVTAQDQPAARPFGGEAGARCKGRLQWLDAAAALCCATRSGAVEIAADGRLQRELDAAGAGASDWIVGAALDGASTAAVGGGHLLVWAGAGRRGEADGKRARR
jgi:hypothetical protein